jgi:thymidylate synthase (FAD)
MKDPLNDTISSVDLLDHMGSDLTVVNAARVSMDKVSLELVEGDTKLINYLAKHGHWTPFSQPQIQLRIKMPIFIARQWFKHQVGFTRNEMSRRYVSSEPELYMPTEWRGKAESVKQGSGDVLPDSYDFYDIARDASVKAIKDYNLFIRNGVCPEQARMVLPQSMYTEFVETGSLAAYARLAKLRLDPHSQKEIQWYAQAVSDIIEPLFPKAWEALSNH